MKINMFLRRYFIIAVILLALPAVVQAQFTYITNNGAITIAGYNGPGGAVAIPNTINGYPVTGIGDYAFAYSTNLTSVAITNSITSIGSDAFDGCTSLASVGLTNSLISIGEEAFYGCISLTNCYIPSSVTNIGEEAFVGCASLINISADAVNPLYSGIQGVLFDKKQNTLIAYPGGLTTTNGTYIIPSNVISIGPYAFASCSHLRSINLPPYLDSLNTIGNFAFSGCSGLASVIMTNIIFGGDWMGPANIGAGAFTFCSSLTNVVIAGTVTNLGGLAFAFCPALRSAYFLDNSPPDVETAFYADPNVVVYYPPGTTGWGPTFGGAPTVLTPTPASRFEYLIEDGSVTIQQYNEYGASEIISPSSAVAIPSSIDGYPVTTIEGNPFCDGSVTSLIIPDSVTNIESQAFEGSHLVSVSIPDSVTSIGFSAFQDCGNLDSVTIPGSVNIIGNYAFEDCTSLTSAIIDNGVTGIANSMFEYCSSLANVSIATSVTNIGEGAFRYCFSLSSVGIPNGLTDIGSYAFTYCTSLAAVIIPASVTSIGDFAFADCTNLTTAYFQGNAPPDDGTIFSGDPNTIVYYLPGTTGWGATFGGAPTELWNPQATSFITSRNQFGLNITGPTNLAIVVEACTNLANPVWLPVSTNTLSSNGASLFSDPQRGNFPNRYYRFSAP